MPNTNAPFGFQLAGRLEGGATNAGQTTRQIAFNAGAIYNGDPVTSLATGFVSQSTAGTDPVYGVFIGCTYLSTALGRVVWSPYWPGAGVSAQNATAYIIDDASAIFRVQATTGPITFADIGANVQFSIGTGNTATGFSGASVGSPATTPTLPFRIVDVITNPPGVNGTDVAAAYNQVIVAFNNQAWKQLSGI